MKTYNIPLNMLLTRLVIFRIFIPLSKTTLSIDFIKDVFRYINKYHLSYYFDIDLVNVIINLFTEDFAIVGDEVHWLTSEDDKIKAYIESSMPVVNFHLTHEVTCEAINHVSEEYIKKEDKEHCFPNLIERQDT